MLVRTVDGQKLLRKEVMAEIRELWGYSQRGAYDLIREAKDLGGEPEMIRSSRVSVEMRVTKVFDMLVENESRAMIQRFVAEESGWNVGERTVDGYINSAKKLFDKVSDAEREVILQKGIAGLQNLFKKADEIGDEAKRYEMKRKILMDQLELQVGRKSRVDVSDKRQIEDIGGKSVSEYSNEELQRMVNEPDQIPDIPEIPEDTESSNDEE